ncbi:hypothetical protein C8A03DRAFT_13763 [Achaetomium macrosporum]|uniref:Myb-like domain-containing protein n=1 Tax=Achaetomium macrosporum TaxID=79813 RepID=A0AAN7CDQ4_9PEZI|nr:hypothetical protein C8A03DRAFT_13763 [Achaetomium macrosporum]
MLKKNSGFKPKPKAAVRRPPPGPGSQGAQRPSTTEPSKTPAPQESSSSQSQAAPHPTPSTPRDVTPVVVSAETASTDADTASQVEEKQTQSTVAAPPPQANSKSPVIVPGGRKEGPAPTAAPIQTQETSSQGGLALQEPIRSKKPAAGTDTSNKATSGQQSAAAEVTPAATASTGISTASPDLGNVVSQETPPTTQATFALAPGPSTAAKPARGRKRTSAAVPVEDSVEHSTPAPAKKRLRKRAAPLPGEEAFQAEIAAPATSRSRKRSRSSTENGDAGENGEGNSTRPRRKPPRSQREATPPDAENVEIDITQVKMADLAKDMHIGKKFSLHDELMERERAKRLRYNERRKWQQNGEDVEDAVANGEAATGTSSSNSNTKAEATPAAAESADTEASTGGTRAPIGEQYQIINGEIVLDHRSLQVDRHARAREEAGQLLEVEENDFTHHTTSATYLRRNLKPQQWTDEETELFYQALSAFGTDFDTICRMFKGKTRKHIKLKFNREERLAPERINAALVGQKTVTIDMEQYQRATGQEYEPAEAIYAEQKRVEEEFEAKQKELEDKQAEEVRRKKEEVLAQLSNATAEESQGGKKGRGRKKKAPAVVGL